MSPGLAGPVGGIVALRRRRLDQPYDIPIRIREPGELARWNPDGRRQRLPAKLSRSIQIGLDVIHFYVESHVLFWRMAQRRDMTFYAFPTARLDHRCRARTPNLPVKQLGIETARLRAIPAADLEMYNRSSHFMPPCEVHAPASTGLPGELQ
jgi:hypothetical protein